MRKIYLLISLLSLSFLLAQDPHVYWEFNTEPVDQEDYYDEHFYEFSEFEYGEHCAENIDDGYYICSVKTLQHICGPNSGTDLAIIKIGYDGEFIDTDYVCDFNVSNPGQTEHSRGIAYHNGFLYMVFYATINNSNNPGWDLYDEGTEDYVGKFSLDGNPIWVNSLYGCEGQCNSAFNYDYMNIDNDGNVIVLGSTNETWYGNEGQNASTYGTTILKYDSNGNLLDVIKEHMGYKYISGENWDTCPATVGESPETFVIDENNNLYFTGKSYCGGLGGSIPYIGKVDLSNENVIWVKNIVFDIPLSSLQSISISDNGNMIVAGQQGPYPALGLVDSNGNFIRYKQYVNCYEEPYYSCYGQFLGSSFLPDGNIVVSGDVEFTDEQQYLRQGVIFYLNADDLEIDRIKKFDGGNPNAAEDRIHRVSLTSNNTLLLSGKEYISNHEHAVVYNISAIEGCTNIESCNYNEFADYDDGSCWSAVSPCTCSEAEGSVADACGECNGNGYDTCDTDLNGTSNYAQWGYGAYNIALEDIPDDYGGGLYMTFNKSFYDQGSASRNASNSEFYTIERFDAAGWVSLNSISAYNQDTYTTEVSTQFDGIATQFRVIANMDEGTFISTESGTGTSIDNLTVLGCMDIVACNYNSQATLDNGTCEYAVGTCDCSSEPLTGYCGCGSETIDTCGDCSLNPTDTDSDTIPDSCDDCPNDPDNDADADSVCGDVDLCPGVDDLLDTDEDGVVDCLEVLGCMDSDSCNFSATATDDDGNCFLGYVYCYDGDEDGLGDPDVCQAPSPCEQLNDIPNFVYNNDDLCPDDTTNDSDGDGVCDSADQCPGVDETLDFDSDGIPDCLDDTYCENEIDPNYGQNEVCKCDRWTYASNQLTCYYIDPYIIEELDSTVCNNYYVPPTYQQLNQFRCHVQEFLNDPTSYNGENGFCPDSLSTLGYEILTYESYTFFFEKDTDPSQDTFDKGWGTFVYKPSAGRENLIIEVNHPDADISTEWIGTNVFEDTDAAWLLVAGAERWACVEGEECTEEENCGADMAREQHSVFQVFHEEITNYFNGDAYVLSIHGFDGDEYDTHIVTDEGGNDEVGIVISNGDGLDGEFLAPSLLTQMLVGQFNSEILDSTDNYQQPAVTVYDAISYNYFNFDSLGATLNPQGSYSNTNFPSQDPRWIHIEADSDIRRTNNNDDGLDGFRSQYYDAIANAVNDFYSSTNLDSYGCDPGDHDTGACNLVYCDGTSNSGMIYDDGVCQCAEGYTMISEECYYQSDLDVLQNFIDLNESLSGEPLGISPQVWNDGRLISLNLNTKQLTTLPESIGDLSNLTYLNLSVNQLASLPESIVNLSSLEELSINYNQLTTLPESIGNLSSLVSLSLPHNQLTTLPESIVNLSNLEGLNVPNNQLTTLPESIGNLSSLWILQLYSNQLTTLPESICNLNIDWNNYYNFECGNNNICDDIPECIIDTEGFNYIYDWDIQEHIYEPQSCLSHGPIVGNVTSSSATFVLRTDVPANVKCELSTSADFTNSILTDNIDTETDNDNFGKVSISNLTLNTKYYYRPVIDEIPLNDGLERYFKTFPEEGSVGEFTFLSGSCQQDANDPFSNIGSLYSIIASQETPAFFLHQGDWGYPDTTDDNTPEGVGPYFPEDFANVQASYRSKYNPSYLMTELLRITPIDYVYDDHDMANNNADRTFPGIVNSIKGYDDYFPHYPLASASNGLWHKFSYGNADFFVIDNRSQRDPNLSAFSLQENNEYVEFTPPSGHTILGIEQMNWLLTELTSSAAKWKFISTGTSFNPAQRMGIELAVLLQGIIPGVASPQGYYTPTEIAVNFADSWAGFPEDITQIIDHVSSNSIENVIFLSGDSHTSGLDDGNSSIFPELMAGPTDRVNSAQVALYEQRGLPVWNHGGHTSTIAPSDFGVNLMEYQILYF